MTYVLAHTHWDREWFVTARYTEEWLPQLFEKLFQLFEEDPSFEYVLDGQTLIVEDLLRVRPDMEEKVSEYVRKGNLKVGPVYAQLDWRISIPQAIWMNFEIGKRDCERIGGCLEAGWFMDNFGQISQLPQIMRIFGIKHAFVWRGLRETFPAFTWRSPDGSEVKTVGLVGGYRTLYNLSDTLDISIERMKHETEKLKKLGEPVVLMDGYDLDLHPENPRDSLKGEFKTSIEELLEEIDSRELPVVEGELLSGKIASIFPGTLSSRTYLKVGADFVGKLLVTLDFIESVTAGRRPWELWRSYLRTLVHDNICGVGVDQIHEEMEEEYRRIFSVVNARIRRYSTLLGLDGEYVFSPSKYKGIFTFRDKVYEVDAKGVGLWRVKSHDFMERGGGDFEPFDVILERENGDAYSSDCEEMEFQQELKLVGSYESEGVERYVFERTVRADGVFIETRETYDVMENLVWMTMELNPKGCCYRFSLKFPADGEVYAGMPFDVVKRPRSDEDLYPEDETLGGILLAAREVGKIEEFPMQDFVAFVSDSTTAVLSKGLRSYVCRGSDVLIPVMRSVEWITKSVRGRSGDAGPKMYVPGARCERRLRVEIGLYRGDLKPWNEDFLSMVRFLTWPKLLLKAGGGNPDDILIHPDGSVLPGVIQNGVRLLKRNGEWRIRRGRSEVSMVVEQFPFGRDESEVSEEILRKLEEEKERLLKEAKKLRDSESVKEKHRYWTLMRTAMEIELSLLLNRQKALERRVGDVAAELNELRRKKRTYDYILEFWEARS